MNRKIKVAFFAEMLVKDFDGAARTMFQLIDRIPSDRFEFMFFCGTGPEPDFPYPYKVIPSIKIPKNEDYRLALHILALLPLHIDLREFMPDVIHISTPSFLGRFALDYGHSHNIPIITIYHTHFISYIDYYFSKFPPLAHLIKNFVINRNKSFYDKCALVYIPSPSLASELESYHFQTSGFKIWRRGLNTSVFTPTNKDENLFKIYHDQGLKIILFASRIVWEKNLSTLIEVYKMSERENLPYHFVVVGDGVAKEEIQHEMPNATFPGNLSHTDLCKYYASADVFLFPSDTETFGNVVVEAMASALPCVVADAGGPRDLVDHGVTGFRCVPHDAESYLKALSTILNDADLRENIVQKGLQFAKSMDWKLLADEYFSDIESLAGQSKLVMA